MMRSAARRSVTNLDGARQESRDDHERHVIRRQTFKAGHRAKRGASFQARFFGGALFSILLLVLISWVGLLGLVIWRVFSSLFG
jgi:hypothetical protein